MNKTLICVICHTKTWEITWTGFKKHLLDELHADLAVCLSIVNDYNYSNPFWSYSKYKITFPNYEDCADGFDYIQDCELNSTNYTKPNWRRLLEIGHENWLGGIYKDGFRLPYSGALSWIARWHLLRFIEEENIFQKYDRLIITRSDYLHTLKHPSMKWLDPQYVWVPDGEGYGGITDRHAILSKYNYKSYLDMAAKLVIEPDVYYRNMIDQVWNSERFLRHHLGNNHTPIRFYPYHMYLIGQVNDNFIWHEGSFSTQHGHYIANDSEYRSTTSLTYHVDTQEGWKNIIVKNNASNCFNAEVLYEGNTIVYDPTIDHYRMSFPNDNFDTSLILDAKNSVGELFLCTKHMGLFERVGVVQVFVEENNDGSFKLRIRNTGEFLAVQGGMLAKIYEQDIQGNYYPITFRLRNRYHKVLHEKVWNKE